MALKWIDQHLEEFVRPHLKTVPADDPGNKWISEWDQPRILALINIWVQAKRRSEGRPILLAGRDVFQLEILARLEDCPTLLLPEISSRVARSGVIPKGTFDDHYLIDTGYSGSVPKGLGMTHWDLIKYSGESDADLRALHQVFPKMGWDDDICMTAGALERAPKYWEQGEVEWPDGYNGYALKPPGIKPLGIKKQGLMNGDMFVACAMLTQRICKVASPRLLLDGVFK